MTSERDHKLEIGYIIA